MEVSIYYGDLPIGPEFPVVKYIDVPLIEEGGMRPFEFNSMTAAWQEIPMSLLNTSSNGVQFFINHVGFFGVAGPLMSIPELVPVGGISVLVGTHALLAPYIGLASTILVATVATAICAKRTRRKKKK